MPGLVALFSRLAIDAADPEHPAHDFFEARSAGFRAAATRTTEQAQRDGRVDDRLDPVVVARMIQALADGMHLRLLLDPDTDMAAPVAALFDLLNPPS
ncbi:TetR family transcriptional regulator C-terminal domain-containing protein [Microbacterium aurum]